MRGSSMSKEELAALGVSREYDIHMKTVYTVPCSVCGRNTTTRSFSTNHAYKCRMCRKKVVQKRDDKAKIIKQQAEELFAEEFGLDVKHLRRFEKGAAKFSDLYVPNIETARKAADKFESIPEVIACISLLHIGARVIAHQKVGCYTVDFCLPDEKTVIEIDGSLYHNNAEKEFIRDLVLKNMLGDGWEVCHVPADAVAKNHAAFERNMRRKLNDRREELGIKPLPRRK